MSWNPVNHYQDETVAAKYDESRFSSLAGRAFAALERRLVARAFAGLAPGALVLDLPCGTGRLAELLLSEGYRVVGADISPAMLRVAKERLLPFGDRFTTIVVDARRLDGKGPRYDGALCARVLMHFPLAEQVEFLAGVARATNGPVVFTQSIDSPYQRFRRFIKGLLRHRQPARYPLTERDLAALLAGAGLKLRKRYRLLPVVSEAMIVVAERC